MVLSIVFHCLGLKSFTHLSVPTLQDIQVRLRLQEVLLNNCKNNQQDEPKQLIREIQKWEKQKAYTVIVSDSYQLFLLQLLLSSFESLA